MAEDGDEALASHVQKFKSTVQTFKFLLNFANPFVVASPNAGVISLLELQDRLTSEAKKKAKLVAQVNNLAVPKGIQGQNTKDLDLVSQVVEALEYLES